MADDQCGAKARPGEPALADAGLRVLVRQDGTWLEFTSPKGRQARVEVRRIADVAGTTDAEVIKKWCADRQVLTTL
jgi:hypothetical protein